MNDASISHVLNAWADFAISEFAIYARVSCPPHFGICHLDVCMVSSAFRIIEYMEVGLSNELIDVLSHERCFNFSYSECVGGLRHFGICHFCVCFVSSASRIMEYMGVGLSNELLDTMLQFLMCGGGIRFFGICHLCVCFGCFVQGKSAGGMDGASGLQSLGSERETWIDEEVEALLDVWGDTYIHVKRENLGKRHWETVVREVNARLAHQREQPQMKNKIDSLKKRYKREKLSKGDNDRNLITWKWYDRCDMLWGTPKREMVIIGGPVHRIEATTHQQVDMIHQDSSRLVPFLAAMQPDGDQGVKAAASRIGDEESTPRAEVPPSPCTRCRGNAEPGKENVKRRKLGTTITTQSMAKIVQGFADTYARVEQAKMEMTMAMEERHLQFLERMEARRLENEERHMERKVKMEERRLELEQKLMEQKLEMQEKHMERRENLKLEILRLRLQVIGQTNKPPIVEQQAVQTCEKFSSSNITTCI